MFARHSFVLFERRSSADVFDLLISALTGRQREQLQVHEAPSFDDGTDAILRAAVEGPGLTVAVREMFEPVRHPELRAVPFAPPHTHDVVLMWRPDRDSPGLRAVVERCAYRPDESDGVR